MMGKQLANKISQSGLVALGLSHLKINCEWGGAVFKRSAVGESKSNGRAEKAVQTVEDQMRTLKFALEDHIEARIPSIHPVTMWLAEYTGVLLTKHSVDPHGI